MKGVDVLLAFMQQVTLLSRTINQDCFITILVYRVM